jgi:hypothetical protein
MTVCVVVLRTLNMSHSVDLASLNTNTQFSNLLRNILSRRRRVIKDNEDHFELHHKAFDLKSTAGTTESELVTCGVWSRIGLNSLMAAVAFTSLHVAYVHASRGLCSRVLLAIIVLASTLNPNVT